MSTYSPPPIESSAIPSPALIFIRSEIERNISQMVTSVDHPGRLRPHIKTHKCPEIVKMKMAHGISKFKCATLAEVQMLAQTGAADILMAYQPVGPNVGILRELVERFPQTTISCIVDNPTVVQHLSDTAAERGITIPVFIDFDVGMHRTGIGSLEDAVQLGVIISRSEGIEFRGVHAYDGHHNEGGPDVRRAAAEETVRIVDTLNRMLANAGLEIHETVMSGTPMFPFYSGYSQLTLSPGTLVLNDHNHHSRYPDLSYGFGALILSRVISIPRKGIFTIDAGAKAISVDHPDKAVLVNHRTAIPGPMSEEHWQYTSDEDIAIGDTVLLIPAHVCTAVHHYDRAYVIDDDGQCTGTWEIAARGRIRLG